MTNKKIKYQPIDPHILELKEKHHDDPEAILEMLAELQEERHFLEKRDITDIGRAVHIPPASTYGVASFYSMLNLDEKVDNVVRVCDGPVCWLCGGEAAHTSVDQAMVGKSGWKVTRTSCLGLCDRAPAVLINDQQAGPLVVGTENEIIRGWHGKETDYRQPRPGELRVMMANAGVIEPDSLASALQYGAYQGLQSALQRESEAVLSEVEASGLTGRGGAGFPVGRKWRFVYQAKRKPKYIVCNADESEPLIFKDRVLIDTNPHQILEGMAVAGYACGAAEGYIYIRGEYARQAERLIHAVREAEQAGYLGERICGTDFSFHIHVHRGAGAYICGEETALIESLEGKRGEPRTRPPYPPSFGYHGLPTLVNNVESYAAVPAIIQNGSVWYRSMSAAVIPGTKMYMLLGHINHPGLFEAPFGLTLRQLIQEFGGGMPRGSKFNFALTGGAAGTIVSEMLMDIPIDYASGAKGISLGAGAFLICDQRVSVVAFLREILHFFRVESCGKCTPCRVGTYRAYEVLKRMAAGEGRAGDVDELFKLAEVMFDSSFCGLGQSVPIPMRSALTQFPQAFKQAERQT
ncbi:MAG TPA: NADH-ubiquinone oxidoreductase-F iron-sulfur binding region domain-containing protein [Anaerolineales bacterium]|nr:NADH-ubiquinone oxidoreductase-F iron-sulfur binding region domain-containing protein [Anaerolineales bacterium]